MDWCFTSGRLSGCLLRGGSGQADERCCCLWRVCSWRMWRVVGCHHCTSDCPYWRALRARNLRPIDLSLLRSMRFRKAAQGLGSSALRCTSHFLGDGLHLVIVSPAACCDFRVAWHCRSHRSWESAGPRCTVPQHQLRYCQAWYLCGQYPGGVDNLGPRRIGSKALLWFSSVQILKECCLLYSTWSWCCIYLSFKAWSHRLSSNTCLASDWSNEVN